MNATDSNSCAKNIIVGNKSVYNKTLCQWQFVDAYAHLLTRYFPTDHAIAVHTVYWCGITKKKAKMSPAVSKVWPLLA